MERYREKLGVLGLLFDVIKMKVGTVLLGELIKISGWFLDIGSECYKHLCGRSQTLHSSVVEMGSCSNPGTDSQCSRKLFHHNRHKRN